MAITPEIEHIVPIPEGVTVGIDGNDVTIEGPGGTLTREFRNPNITISVKDLAEDEGSASKGVSLYSKFAKSRQRALIGTWRSHITNMVHGVTEGYEYELKIVHSHFPMKVAVKDGEVVIDNFMGERFARRANIVEGTEIQVKGDAVIVTGIDKEKVGQSAANIEHATKVKGYDPRVFQDGIYIVRKG